MMYPDAIQNHLSDYTTSGKNHRTSSHAQVYLFQKIGAPDLFLKISGGDEDAPLLMEKEAMDWLRGKIPVPRVLAYVEIGDTAYLLTERLPGTSSENKPCIENPESTVTILAEGLRCIHAVTVEDCPLPKYIANGLIQAAIHNIESGIVTEQTLNKRGDSRTPQDALSQVQSLRPKTSRLVFTHGDYCLPNILIHNSKLSGFIDWGSAGPGDPHRDLVSAQYSIRRNLGEQWLDPFFDHYGREHLNPDSLAFYTALYELI